MTWKTGFDAREIAEMLSHQMVGLTEEEKPKSQKTLQIHVTSAAV